ncbi:alpha-amylase family glycosyl hydrolase [Pontibacter sp. SGAir0037]|uniref:alpha-amylase family glycosyl hydrolase n=1 Tax=Pontibacter sp. SGAir0037 TaxID=2571030 RepID=UPI0010CCD009|nr:alpha-amylase family glycosyl hydrolase [Pontibacter sp. SGAir0037]QCR22791.1 alpha-amylase [Pontibacter sp. SGAir0037]
MNNIKLLLTGLCLSLSLLWQHQLQAQGQITQAGKPFQKVPDPRDAVIYQINIRAFSTDGNFKGVIPRLDSIKALGVNVIYLMPIYPIGKLKSVNSPYCISDYRAINSEFGELEDLRKLVEEAHQREMAVILDWVANHTSYDHTWVQHKSWYLQDSLRQIISPPGTGWNDVAQLNFKNKEMRQEMINSMKYWIAAANIDGFRCDYADGPPFDFWQQAVDTLRAISNRKLLLLAEGSRNDHFKAGFDYKFGFRFFQTLSEKVYSENKPVTLLQEVNAAEYDGATSTEARVVRYTSNHDVNLTDGTPLELFGGKQGALAAFVVAAYMKGVPMLYNGQEIGYNKRLQFFSRTPIEWSSADYKAEAEYKKIIRIYNSNKTIRRGELTDVSSNDVCVFTKELDGEKVLVMANFRKEPVQYTVPPALAKITWRNAFSGAKETVRKPVSLKPFEYLVLRQIKK